MTRVVILHQHTNNFGDDAAGAALAKEVRETLRAGIVDVFYIWHKGGGTIPTPPSGFRHHHLNLLSGRTDTRARLAAIAVAHALLRICPNQELRALLQSSRAADAVFVAPAGSNLGLYKDWMYLLVLFILTNAGVRMTFCLNSFAASGSRVFDRLALFVLRRARVFTREIQSREYLNSRRVRATLGADTALVLARHRENSGNAIPSPTIALVPTSLSTWHRDFRAIDDEQTVLEPILAAVVEVAIEQHFSIDLVPHLYGPENEAILLDRIQSRLTDMGCDARVLSVTSYLGYIDALSRATVAISMRYHGVLCAAMSGTPCLSICYEEKMRDAADYLGYSPWTLDPHYLTRAELASKLRDAIIHRSEVQGLVRARTAELAEISRMPILEIRAALLRSPQSPC